MGNIDPTISSALIAVLELAIKKLKCVLRGGHNSSLSDEQKQDVRDDLTKG